MVKDEISSPKCFEPGQLQLEIRDLVAVDVAFDHGHDVETGRRATPEPAVQAVNWHDSYVPDAAPDPKWIEVSDAGEAPFGNATASPRQLRVRPWLTLP